MISYIVTTYGETEAQVRRALESLRQMQEFTQEIILIDDGVKNYNSGLFDGYEVGDVKVRLVRQSNQGLCVARNLGVQTAVGKYVAFLDADDECVGMDLTSSFQDSPDMIRFSKKVRWTDGTETIREECSPMMSGADYLNDRVEKESLVESPCVYLYRREWMVRNKLLFTPGLLHEDMLFVIYAIGAAGTIVAIPQVGYIYHRRPDSITSSLDTRRHRLRVKSLRQIHLLLVMYQYRNPQLKLRKWLYRIRNYSAYIARRSPSRATKYQLLLIYLQLVWTGYVFFLRDEWSFIAAGARTDFGHWVYLSSLPEVIDR